MSKDAQESETLVDFDALYPWLKTSAHIIQPIF